ncbi:MAG: ribosomal RNA small subunit methyltransferase A [Thermomicrobiales bacterium]|nr:ribosomal RNA small subunit methyltransferase A [Thermomicrobiales bacterium]MCO5222660.1 16S rRNA (adenine(1518)-N(6)/adenine(1519)-N(6))-dimethyltransferase RsmA [Thermomicrobiales bacterium]
MTDFPTPSRKFLEEIGVRPSKGRGQNFLKEAWVVERIAAELGVGPGDTVVEVGPGIGALTGALLDTGATVRAVELDEQLATYLRTQLAGRDFSVIQADARVVSIDELLPEDTSYDLAANLPYSSAPVILRHFLEAEHPPERSILMVQREVALRMTAEPPDMSILGVAIQVYATGTVLFDVPAEAFVPKPKIMSSVVLLDRREAPLVAVDDRATFFQLVTAGFAQKRKTILNSLAAALPAERESVRRALESAGIDPMRRAETLSVEDWLALMRMMPSS